MAHQPGGGGQIFGATGRNFIEWIVRNDLPDWVRCPGIAFIRAAKGCRSIFQFRYEPEEGVTGSGLKGLKESV
jgi:hypothetical protein